eukprot:TRINITY_DN11874_c0_g1_i1.p1 TRINITY_DN11874_c0_g1~~TRINITY_DN11874_c0_g1_i1.p1  ORF type:complete len:491 (+),score=61.89 TRINITY_DN11874_c0_g1_i1:24-1475(+)
MAYMQAPHGGYMLPTMYSPMMGQAMQYPHAMYTQQMPMLIPSQQAFPQASTANYMQIQPAAGQHPASTQAQTYIPASQVAQAPPAPARVAPKPSSASSQQPNPGAKARPATAPQVPQHTQPQAKVRIHLVPKNQWMRNSARSSCVLCTASFTFSNRRHHCRVCGCLVCQDCSNRRHPMLGDVRICTTCYSSVVAKVCGLQGCNWFHGTVDRATSEARLQTSVSEVGDFLVRESNSKDGSLVLTILHRKGINHYLIKGQPGNWHIARDRFFATIPELVEHFIQVGTCKRVSLVSCRRQFLDITVEASVYLGKSCRRHPLWKQCMHATVETLSTRPEVLHATQAAAEKDAQAQQAMDKLRISQRHQPILLHPDLSILTPLLLASNHQEPLPRFTTVLQLSGVWGHGVESLPKATVMGPAQHGSRPPPAKMDRWQRWLTSMSARMSLRQHLSLVVRCPNVCPLLLWEHHHHLRQSKAHLLENPAQL